MAIIDVIKRYDMHSKFLRNEHPDRYKVVSVAKEEVLPISGILDTDSLRINFISLMGSGKYKIGVHSGPKIITYESWDITDILDKIEELEKIHTREDHVTFFKDAREKLMFLNWLETIERKKEAGEIIEIPKTLRSE